MWTKTPTIFEKATWAISTYKTLPEPRGGIDGNVLYNPFDGGCHENHHKKHDWG